jgi:hypothetical protein
LRPTAFPNKRSATRNLHPRRSLLERRKPTSPNTTPISRTRDGLRGGVHLGTCSCDSTKENQRASDPLARYDRQCGLSEPITDISDLDETPMKPVSGRPLATRRTSRRKSCNARKDASLDAMHRSRRRSRLHRELSSNGLSDRVFGFRSNSSTLLVRDNPGQPGVALRQLRAPVQGATAPAVE